MIKYIRLKITWQELIRYGKISGKVIAGASMRDAHGIVYIHKVPS